MGWPAEIKADEDHDLPAPVLHRHLAEIDPSTVQVKEEVFATIGGFKGERNRFPRRREVGDLLIGPVLLHFHQGVGFGLSQIGPGH